MNVTTDLCIICGKVSNESLVKVGNKGINTLINFCQKRERGDIEKKILQSESVTVHGSCRRDFTNSRRQDFQKLNPDVEVPKKKPRLRSNETGFSWKDECFLCGKAAKIDVKHPARNNVNEVRTLKMKERILDICQQRCDKWASEIKDRVNDCFDLVASEAIYHSLCLQIFSTGNKSLSSSMESKTPGRSESTDMMKNFNELCKWFEDEMSPVSTTQLHAKMTEIAGSNNVYSMKQMKRKLESRYKDDILISQAKGEANIVCFKDAASFIISKEAKELASGKTPGAEEIIKTASKLIKIQIKLSPFSSKDYPTREMIKNHDNSLTSYLKLFLEGLFTDSLKQSALGQALIKAVKPRSYIPPLLFGLGVELDHVFGSRWLTSELFKLGFSISYDEITRFKRSALKFQDLSAERILAGGYTQWIADNVDHDICTIDGKGTFHGMGIVAAGTFNTKTAYTYDAIPRIDCLLRSEDIVKQTGLVISSYDEPDYQGLSKILFKPKRELLFPRTLTNHHAVDTFLQSLYNRNIKPIPNWSGFMQEFTMGEHPPSSEIVMLPIINLNPSDSNCLYSTLLFVQDQARSLNIKVPAITFDQPLWYKATEIVVSKKMNIVVRLGGFHTLMSFLGSIGSLMEGSGLQEIFEEIYAKNTVPHIFSGKAISRALRAHFLTQNALINILLQILFESSSQELLNQLFLLFDQLMNEEILLDIVADSEAVVQLTKSLEELKITLSKQSRTAKLWINYVTYIDIVKTFIRAERIGDWIMHLDAMQQMLNLFAATGHVNYTRSARLYLQLMSCLDKTHPWLYQQYCKGGFHCIRRSDRYWAGLWPDLIIEQCMMRSIKNRGGLTRGRGMNDSTRNLWIHTMHICGSIHSTMTSLTDQTHQVSEQHVELGKSRCERDNSDIEKLIRFIQDLEPFDNTDTRLRCLTSGAIANEDTTINCDRSEEIGEEIHKSMDNLPITSAVVQRKKQINILIKLQTPVKIQNDDIHINPLVLFQRLILLAERSEDISSCFEYELTVEPTSLFKDGKLRKGQKSSLIPKIVNSNAIIQDQENTKFVLDGGALLHRVRWNLPSTYERRKKHVAVDILVEEKREAYNNQSEFLANEKNKTKFIALLSAKLLDDGHFVQRCQGDADKAICDAAIHFAANESHATTVSDDTDIPYFFN